MKLTSQKSGPLKGYERVPGDKSISHRALMLGALAPDETMISGLLEGDDVLGTARALLQMGAKVFLGGDGLYRVHGTGIGFLEQPDGALDMGNSGTSARLMAGMIAGHPIVARMTGDASLSKRPMNRVIKPLTEMGAVFDTAEGGRLPMSITGTAKIKGMTYKLPVASAQVKSAILLAGLTADDPVTVIEATPTRDHTENMLKTFGFPVKIEETEEGAAITVQGGQQMQGCAIDVPADPSSAAFPVVAALINEGSDITLSRVCVNPRRTGLFETLKEMGAELAFLRERTESGEQVADIVVRATGPLKGIDVPPERIPSMIDEIPILAVAAACADGTTKLTGIAELRVKESDRLAVMAKGLTDCGVKLEEGEDSLTIHGTGKAPRGGATIATHLDHRIAMSFLVLGTATEEAVSIDDAKPIQTSFPNFTDILNDLGGEIS